MLLTDHLTLDATGTKTTREGFLVAEPRIARTGIQEYRAAECGLTDRAADDTVRILREEGEVFATDALRSFSAIDLTVDHPQEMVDAKNWKKYAAGNTGEGVLRDGEFLRCPIIVKDQVAIDAIKAGKAELSVGYTCELDMTPGTTPSGEAYDGVQRNIRANHLAICDRARGGSLLRIGDQGEPAMNLKKILVDGLQVETTDAGEAAIVKLQGDIKALTDAKGKAETDLAAKVTELTTKDAEIVTLKQQLKDAEITPAKLADAAKAYGEVVGKAKALGVVVAETMDTAAIQAAVVNAKLGDAAKGWTADQIATSFATLAAGVKVGDANPGTDPFRAAVLGDGLQVQDAQAAFAKARQARLDRLNGVVA